MTTLYNPGQNLGKAITRGFHPGKAQSLYVPLDFGANPGDDTIQVSLPMQAGISNVIGINNAQSVFIDNSNNAEVLTLTFNNQFEVVAPAYTLGIYPLLISSDSGLIFKAVTTGGVLCKTWFTNTREQPVLYLVQSNFAGTVSVSGSIIYESATRANWTDRSVTIAAGGVSQLLVPANGARLGFAIRNPATPASQGIAAPEPIYVNFGIAAAVNGVNSWELLPGETLMTNQMGICSTQVINVAAATVGHVIIAKEA